MAKFDLGQLLSTPGAIGAATQEDLMRCIGRHVRGDWGALCDADQRANDQALTSGGRLLSAYLLPSGVKLWVITEADRSATTVLLPDEY